MPRIIVRIELTPEAKSRFGSVAGRYGRTQVDTMSRIVEWFSMQPEGVQAAVLGQFPRELEPEVAKLLLSKMAQSAPELVEAGK